MAGNVRGRLLTLFRILTEQTDENRTMTMPELLQTLENLGFSADRRALYEDIEALNNAGWEVQRSDTGKRGYFYASRDFDDAEIGLLLDSLYTCDFLPESKLHRLSDKLAHLGTSALAMNRSRRNSLLIAQSREHDNRSIYAVDLLYKQQTELSTQHHCLLIDRGKEWERDKDILRRHSNSIQTTNTE